jgi:hypothetical protein
MHHEGVMAIWSFGTLFVLNCEGEWIIGVLKDFFQFDIPVTMTEKIYYMDEIDDSSQA